MHRASTPCPQLEDQLCFAVYAAGHAFNAAYKPLLEPLGLTYPQYLVLMILWEGDGLAVGRLGSRLHLDSGTLTPLLKRMERAGLVTRERDADDERQVLIRLTAQGQGLRSRAAGLGAALACRAGETEPALAGLRDGLERITTRLRAGS